MEPDKTEEARDMEALQAFTDSLSPSRRRLVMSVLDMLMDHGASDAEIIAGVEAARKERT